MNEKRKKAKFRKNKLSIYLAVLALVTAVLCMSGMEFLRFEMEQMSADYVSIVEKDYYSINNITQLKRDIYEHQSYVFHHLMEKDKQNKLVLGIKIDKLRNEILSQVQVYKKDVNGDEYDNEFNDISEDMNSYLTKVYTALQLSNNGEIENAAYYIHTTLEASINAINYEINNLHTKINNNIIAKRNKIEKNMSRVRSLAMGILIFIIIVTSVSIVFCVRMSDEMVGKDLLTGVANFDKLLKIGRKLSARKKLSRYDGVALNIIDFKYINQEYGSLNGDYVLRNYAYYISSKLSKTEVIARNGGDSFFLLIEKSDTKEFISEIQNIKLKLEDGKEISIDSRGGVYPITEDDNIRDMVNFSLIALGESRNPGRDQFTWYDEKIKAKIIEEKKISSSFERAIANNEFVVYYQPKVDLKEYKLCGCEALVRWVSDGEIIPPDKFIYIFEKEGFIEELDFYVFENVCKQINEWKEKKMDIVRVSSNFSKVHLKNPDLGKKIKSIIKKYNVEPKYFEIEFTESSLYEDVEFINDFIVEMNSIGIHVSMDDFGTAYSSLSFLRDIEMNVVKLDRSFLFRSDDYQNMKMVEYIVMMLNELDKTIVCEGVETKKQADFLESINCQMAQGYMFDKPLTKKEFEKRLREPSYERLRQ